jgi:hypothetical protein
LGVLDSGKWNMAHATLRFDLSDPDDEREHRYALAGREALIALEQIDQHCRGRLKHGEPTDARRELEQICNAIPYELVNLLR